MLTQNIADIIMESENELKDQEVIHGELGTHDWNGVFSEDITAVEFGLTQEFFHLDNFHREEENLENLLAQTEVTDFNMDTSATTWYQMAGSYGFDVSVMAEVGKEGKTAIVKKRLAKIQESIGATISKIIGKLREFLRNLFDMNDRRQKAANDLLNAMKKRKAGLKKKTISLKGPSRYFVGSADMKPLELSVIGDAIQKFKEADLDQIGKNLANAHTAETVKSINMMIRKQLEGVLEMGPPKGITVSGDRAVFHLAPDFYSPLALVITRSKDSQWSAMTMTDKKAAAKVDSRKKKLEVEVTAQEIIDLLELAESNFDVLKELKDAIPKEDFKAGQISEATDTKAIQGLLEFVSRLCISSSRYGTILSTGSIKMARDYYGAFYKIADKAQAIIEVDTNKPADATGEEE
ncbi:hypothetical protein CZP2022_164 [Vibrio phage C-ZP2022]|nr:hypothetical protein CZP2022_164 [Vibrio phage C-ZP2022]